MAVFDRELQRIVLRIVYDGPARAGKTTNLAQLQRFFTTLRRGELVSHAERTGRTLFFDWLHLDGGLVGGYPLRCQLTSVPGQAVLIHRRRLLLAAADAVVFVCESSRDGVEIGRRLAADLPREVDEAGPRVPLVVQANKQDQRSPLDPTALPELLGLAATTPALGARAHEGVGVRETLVLAIRAAANRAQRLILERGVDALAGRAETHEELLARLQAETSGHDTSAGAVLAALATPAEQVATIAPEAAPPAEEPRPAAAAVGDAPPASAPALPQPPFPRHDVPLGFVWPAAFGRSVLQTLAGVPPRRRDDLVGRHGTADGSGRSDTLIYEAAGLCLKTSARLRFDEIEAGRAAMLHLARRKTLLGPLLPPRSVLCLQPAEHGAELWLWTVTPWVTTLRAWMARAVEQGDEATLQVALEAFARAAVDALALAARAGVALDVHPSNFALADGRVVYLDDDVATGERLPAIGHVLLRRVAEYARFGGCVEAYLTALEQALEARLAAEEAAQLGLRPALLEAVVRGEAIEPARARLVAAVERLGAPRQA